MTDFVLHFTHHQETVIAVLRTQKQTGFTILLPLLLAFFSSKTATASNVSGNADEAVIGLPISILTHCSICPDMILLPAGTVQIGDLTGEGNDDEQPTKQIRIASFAIGRFEVTFAEFDQFTKDTGRKKAVDHGWGRTKRPAINVSWEEAVAYTQWLSEKTGEKFRLPSEAEWQYAAYAGRNEATPLVENPGALCRIANHADASTQYRWRNIACRDGYAATTGTTGRYLPNDFGLHDIHGNVFEWVLDCYVDSYRNTPSDGSAVTAENCDQRVMKGGSWYSHPKNLRVSNRSKNKPSAKLSNLGFRVALELQRPN